MQLLNPVIASVGETLVKVFDAVARLRGSAPDLPDHLVLGEKGEEDAMFYLMRKGYSVVERRWHDGSARGDLDLVAWDHETLCFIEVKTRGTIGMAAPEMSVDAQKRRTLRRLARRYLHHLSRTESETQQQRMTRFDVVSILRHDGGHVEVTHIPGAFGWSERRPDS